MSSVPQPSDNKVAKASGFEQRDNKEGSLDKIIKNGEQENVD